VVAVAVGVAAAAAAAVGVVVAAAVGEDAGRSGVVGKAEEKRAAIIAAQAARELAEPRVATPSAPPKRRANWAATGPIGRPGRGRPPKPREES
jgi:hypothetical protein